MIVINSKLEHALVILCMHAMGWQHKQASTSFQHYRYPATRGSFWEDASFLLSEQMQLLSKEILLLQGGRGGVKAWVGMYRAE